MFELFPRKATSKPVRFLKSVKLSYLKMDKIFTMMSPAGCIFDLKIALIFKHSPIWWSVTGLNFFHQQALDFENSPRELTQCLQM